MDWTSFIKLREANAESLFEAINKNFSDFDLNYGNLIGVGPDGANVMMG